MMSFQISANDYLARSTRAFFHVQYTGMGRLGNPDYLNVLKNTFNDFSEPRLQSAVLKLHTVLQQDISQVYQLLDLQELTACAVPRAKAENAYQPTQQLFRTTVQAVVAQTDGIVDGTSYIRRHTNTRTTHLRNPVRNYRNDGPMPYPGITLQTCEISPNVNGKDILLIDDIYTPNVNVDEDAISALLDVGARTVTFYAVGKV